VDVDSLVKNGVIGGLGIHLIRHYMDTVTYERKDGQNVLTMTKKRELKNYKIKEL
jgi:sigma-B regulation protein RsbU (phosphoserine phosphatase)